MHAFCLDCMGPFCESLIKEGNVDKLRCPAVTYIDGKTKNCESYIREIDMKKAGVLDESLEKYFKASCMKAVE
jgi:hypothetical protein